MVAGHYVKDPDEILDYQVNWAGWLGNDSIASAFWVVPAGLTLVAQSHTTTAATVWLSGGTAGERYTVTSRVTTAGGRHADRSITLFVEEL